MHKSGRGVSYLGAVELVNRKLIMPGSWIEAEISDKFYKSSLLDELAMRSHSHIYSLLAGEKSEFISSYVKDTVKHKKKEKKELLEKMSTEEKDFYEAMLNGEDVFKEGRFKIESL